MWQSEHEVTMVSQLLKRMQTCLKTVVIHHENYRQSPERAVVPKIGEELTATVLEAEGRALLLQGDVAINVHDVPFLRLALSLGGAGAQGRAGDTVGAGLLGGRGGEGGAVEGEGGGLSGGPGDGLAGGGVHTDLLAELWGGDVGRDGGDEGGVPGGVGGEAGGEGGGGRSRLEQEEEEERGHGGESAN